MKITYTKHAMNKFKYAEELNWNLSEEDIEYAIQNPDFHTSDDTKKVEIVLKDYDKNSNLRVVYSRIGDIITVITFYLARKGRYEQG